MPVSADLLKALAEDPKSLEHQLGCMAGLFQIFDRQGGLGRRYGSKRVSNAGSGQSQPTSACETPRHDHHQLRSGNNNSADPYWMFVEDSSRFEAKNVSEPHHRSAYSDSSEIFTKSFETPTESRTEKSSQSPMYSEESSVIGGLASWDPDHAHDELKQLNVVVPVRAQQQHQPATDIRDIVRASFERDHIQRAYKEKARHSVDVAAGSHGYLKNLPRSASVDGKDRSMVADVVAAAGSQQSRHGPVADLPRSSSVGGRGASRMLADWKDGLRSSSGSPRLTSKERDALLKQSKNDNRDVTRLTVELKEGPRLSVSVDDRRASVDASPRPISRFRDVPVECPDFNRAADIKEFLRGEKKAGRDGHRFSVDGTRDAPRACIAPRLSVDGRDEAARKTKLVDSGFCRQSSGRKASNVVARLMGLEELPPKETTTTTTTSATPRFAKLEPVLYDQTFLENNHPEFSPPPPPSPPDDYDYAHHSSDHEAFQQRSIHNHFKHQQELLNCQLNTPTLHQEPSYVSNELAISPPEEQAVTPTPPRNDDDDKSSRQSGRKSPQGRRSLWHIFEAMQLKGLLQGSSSRRKQAEALRMHNLKMTESENEEKEHQRRSQSLPPRLNSSSKDLHMILDPTPTVAPAAAQEIRKPSDDEDDDCEVVIKPIITRSMSPYTKTQSSATVTAPLSLPQTSTYPCRVMTDSPRTYILPDEDITPKNISRAMSKSVGAYLRAVVNEQEMSGDSTHSANVRQSRKERGGAARMTKSFSDVPQSEQRDSSPRCLRGAATTTTTPTTPKSLQERPARSCSPRGDSGSSISPRCPAGNAMENAGRVRRKAFAVKDREVLRASATKQEFLKERASGDPDTPRLLRRSSSESKILSKMAESKPESRARSTTPPSMSLLRSKRPVASKSDTNNKSPMKTRPTAAPGLKPVPKPRERGAAKLPVLEGAPADSPKASRCEVRATQGGALDQSSDAVAREAHVRTESKAREKSVEVDEGVKTPRGVSIKKIDFSEDAQAEVAEQPSPVSVLDNSHFDEELTPSPKAGKTSVVSLQEQSLRSEKDRRWSSARFLDLDLEETTAPSAAAAAAAVSSKGPETAATTTAEVEGEPLRHRLRVCLQDADEESRYVEELVYAAELGSGCTSPTELLMDPHNSSYVMDPSIFDQLESKREPAVVESETEKEALDRRILFDCVNEVLERLLETCSARWALQAPPRLRKRPMGRQLLKAVFAELEDIPCAPTEDVCETVYVILQKDLLRGRGQQWPDSHKELEEVSVAVERLIVKDLIEETVRELLSPCTVATPESSRRQLFA